MVLTGVLVNTFSVLVGSLFGLLLKTGLPEKINQALMTGLGLCVLYIGINGVTKGKNALIVVLSISIGSAIGELIDFDHRLNHLGVKLQKLLCSSNDENQTIAKGFVNSTLFVCVGAMSIVGAIESGMHGSFEIFYAKALIDGVVIFVMTTTMGVGCCFSSIVAFLYQAVLTLLANFIAGFLNETMINEMSCVGSILIIGISLNMLKVTNIKIGNFILAPFLPILFYLIIQ